MTTMKYSGYTHYISSDPSYYGTDCTDTDTTRIVESLGNLIQREFPGIEIQPYQDGDGSCATTGPDNDVIEEIERWVEENWTAAL